MGNPSEKTIYKRKQIYAKKTVYKKKPNRRNQRREKVERYDRVIDSFGKDDDVIEQVPSWLVRDLIYKKYINHRTCPHEQEFYECTKCQMLAFMCSQKRNRVLPKDINKMIFNLLFDNKENMGIKCDCCKHIVDYHEINYYTIYQDRYEVSMEESTTDHNIVNMDGYYGYSYGHYCISYTIKECETIQDAKNRYPFIRDGRFSICHECIDEMQENDEISY